MTRSPQRRVMFAMFLCSMLPPAGAMAEQPGAAREAPQQDASASTPLSLDAAVAALIAEDVSSRLRAAETLSGSPDIRLVDLERVLRERRDLSPEQRRKLMSIAKLRFYSEPRGALGIRFAFNDGGGGGAVLADVVQGFPAAEVLRVGDRLLSINGRRIESDDDVRASIVSRDPGERVVIRLARDGKPITVRAVIGTYAGSGFQPDALAQAMPIAWRERSREYGLADLDEPAALSVAFAPDAWTFDPMTDRIDRLIVDGTGIVVEPSGIALGGEPDAVVQPLRRTQADQAIPLSQGGRGGLMSQRDLIRQQLADASVMVGQFSEIVATFDAQAADPTLPIERRRELERQAAPFREQLQVHQRRQQMLRQRLRAMDPAVPMPGPQVIDVPRP